MKIFKGEIELKGDYKLEVNDRYLYVYDKIGNEIYYEGSNGFWAKSVYDKNNNEIYYENSDKFWDESIYDKNNNQIYYKDSHGYWDKSEYDENGNILYYKNGNGEIEDYRPKKVLEVTMQDLEEKYGCKVKVVKSILEGE